MPNFQDYQTLAMQLKESASKTRDTIHQAVEDAFFMRSDVDNLKANWIKPTKAPDLHNATVGAQRMITASDPKFKVPEYQTDRSSSETVNKLIDWATRSCRNSGVIHSSPLHVDMSLSGFLYGEVNVATIRTSTLLDRAKTNAEKRRAEQVMKRTAILPEVLNPRVCYPVIGPLGLETHLTSRKMRNIDIIRRHGEKAIAQLKDAPPFDYSTYNQLFDLENQVEWIEGQTEPLFMQPHEMSVLPIVYRRIEGSTLWDQYDKDVDSVQPFLYAAIKSGLWERYNLSLTVFYSLLFAIASSGLWKFKAANEQRELAIDFTKPGAVIKLLPNEDISPIGTNVLTPEMVKAIEIAEKKLVEATIYKQTLGEPLGANAPFSMVALLHAAGRQPLIPTQRLVSDGLGEVFQNGVVILKEKKEKVEWRNKDGDVVFDPEEIEDDMELEAELDIDLPQDAKQNIQIALEAVKGGVLDLETALRDIVKMDQPEKIIKAIYGDQLVQTIFGGELEKIKATYATEIRTQQMEADAATQQRIRQAMQPQGPPQPGGPGGPPPQMPPQGPPQGPPPQQMPPQGPPPMQGAPQPGGPAGAGQLTPEQLQQFMSNQAQPGLPQTSPNEIPPNGGPNANPS